MKYYEHTRQMRISSFICRESIEDRIRWSALIGASGILDCIPLQRLWLRSEQSVSRAQEIRCRAGLTGLCGQRNEETDGGYMMKELHVYNATFRSWYTPV